MLATLGIPMILIDPGRVEPVNIGLQRYSRDDIDLPKCQALARTLRSIRPDLELSGYEIAVERLAPRALSRCRLVIGCVDRFTPRVWMAQTLAYLGIPYLDLALDGSGHSLYGRASGFDPARGTACYCCSWDQTNWDELSRAEPSSGCAALAGQAPDAPATLALPGLAEAVAGLGAIQAVRLLVDEEPDRVLGREWQLNFTAGRLSETTLTRQPRCRLDHRPWSIVELDEHPAHETVRGLFGLAEARLGQLVSLGAYNEPLVFEAACPGCRTHIDTARLRKSLPCCPTCRGALVPLTTGMQARFYRDQVSAHLDLTWAALGLPPGGAVLAEGDGGDEVTFLFQGDQPAINLRPASDQRGNCYSSGPAFRNDVVADDGARRHAN
jgi:molybdopterin/thiamine biosynthesis adenylyltransferase